jgi:hypothetical protein
MSTTAKYHHYMSHFIPLRCRIHDSQHRNITSTTTCTYLIRKLRHVIGHRPALVLPRAHVISLGVLLSPWAWPITLTGTILHVTKLLRARGIIAWKHDIIMVNKHTEQYLSGWTTSCGADHCWRSATSHPASHPRQIKSPSTLLWELPIVRASHS